MQTEVIEVSKLKLDPNNARKHNRKNLDVIKNSILTFGQRKNIVVDNDNVVLAGNGLLMVAKELGLKTLAANRFIGTAEQAKAYALVDNRAGEMSEWDDEILRETLEGLRGSFELLSLGFDIGEIGFDTSALDEKYGDDDENAPPEEKQPTYTLTVTFENDDAQQELFTELRDRGFKVKV